MHENHVEWINVACVKGMCAGIPFFREQGIPFWEFLNIPAKEFLSERGIPLECEEFPFSRAEKKEGRKKDCAAKLTNDITMRHKKKIILQTIFKTLEVITLMSPM